VAFGEHRIMLRPRDGHDLRVVDGDLSDQGRDRCALSDSALAMWLAEVPHVPDTAAVLLDDIPAPRPRDVDSGFSQILR